MTTTCKYCSSEHKRVGNVCRRCEQYWYKYKIRVPDYNAMLKQQNGKCAICKCDDAKSPTGSFCVDHCHTTNKVRGLLCVNCNTGIGSLKEDSNIFSNALSYLEEHL